MMNMLNTAGFPKLYTKEQFRTDEIDFPEGASLDALLNLDFYHTGKNIIMYGGTGAQLLFDCLSEIHAQKSVILNTNLEFSQWGNVLYNQRMTTALMGRLTHHADLILYPGINNHLRESSINEAFTRMNTQEAVNNG